MQQSLTFFSPAPNNFISSPQQHQPPAPVAGHHPQHGIPQTNHHQQLHQTPLQPLHQPQAPPQSVQQAGQHVGQQQQSSIVINNSSTPNSNTSQVNSTDNGATNGGSEKVAKKKRKRCGDCPGCLKKDNCGECGPCKSVRSHQICKMRKCDQLKTKKEKSRENIQDTGPKHQQQASSLTANIYNENSTVDSTPSPYSGYSNHHTLTGPYNGDMVTSGSGTPLPIQDDSMNSTGSGHGPLPGPPVGPVDNNNRHNMMNSRLKSLIQSRQSSKVASNQSPGNGPPQPVYVSQVTQSTGPPNYTGANYAVSPAPPVSPHYINQGSGGVPNRPPVTQSLSNTAENSYAQMNWQPSDTAQGNPEPPHVPISRSPPPHPPPPNQSAGGDLKSGRRTPFAVLDNPNGYAYPNSYPPPPPHQYDRNTQQQRQDAPPSTYSNDQSSAHQRPHSNGPPQPVYSSQVTQATGPPNYTGANYAVSPAQPVSPHYLNQGVVGGQNRKAPNSSANVPDSSTYAQMNWTPSETAQGNGIDGPSLTSHQPPPHPPPPHPPPPHPPPSHQLAGDTKPGRGTPFSVLDNPNGYSYPNSYSHHYDRNTSQPQRQEASSTYSNDQPSAHQRPHSNGSQYMYTNSPTPNQSQQYSPLPTVRGQQSSEATGHELPSPYNSQSQASATTSPLRNENEPISGGGVPGGGGNVHGSDLNAQLSRDSLTLNNTTANMNGGNISANNTGHTNSNNIAGNHRDHDDVTSTDQQHHQSQPFLSNTTTSMSTYTNIINTYDSSSSVTETSVFYTNSGGVGHDMGIDCGRLMDQLGSASAGFGGLLMDLNPCTVNSTTNISNKSDLPPSILSSSLSSTSSPSSSTASPSSPSLSSTVNFIATESHLNSNNTSGGNTVLPPVSTFLLPNIRDHNWWDRMKTPSYGSTMSANPMDYKQDHHHLNRDSLDCGEEERGEREYSRSPSSTLTSLTAASLTH